jgi:hypothetical protein
MSSCPKLEVLIHSRFAVGACVPCRLQLTFCSCKEVPLLQVQLSAPKQAQNISLMVAVRVRPILKCEIDKGRGAKDILRVMDDCIVLVMDPDPDDKDYLDQVQNRSKVCNLHFSHFASFSHHSSCCRVLSGSATACLPN